MIIKNNNLKKYKTVTLFLVGLFLLPLAAFSKETPTDFIIKKLEAPCNIDVQATILKQPDCGLANGAVCLTVTGATGAISYSWGADIPCYETLNAGDYCVYVTDEENCKDSVLFTLKEVCDKPCNLGITAEIKRQPSCGMMDGWVCITATGGVGGLSYSWGADIPCYETLGPGDYCVYVTDEQNCKDSVLFTLKEPMCDPCDLQITAEIKRQPSCGMMDGWVCITATGGVGDLSYSWGADIPCYETLGPGDYCVYVTDEQNCKDSVLFTLKEPTCDSCELKITAEIKRQPSCGMMDGWVCITATGGVGDLSYSWGADIPCYENLGPGSYFVRVTDELNCKDSVLFTLIEEETCPACFRLEDIEGNGPACELNNGTINIVLSGNTDNITYTWDDDGTINAPTRSGLAAGFYEVTISNGIDSCEVVANALIVAPENCDACMLAAKEIILKQPDCEEANAEVAIMHAGAKSSVTYNWGDTILIDSIRTALAAGDYQVIVKEDNSACADTINFTLEKAAPPSLSVTPDMVCTDSLGSVSFNLAGCFVGPVDVTVLDGNGNEVASIVDDLDGIGTITGLSAGANYQLLITDSNGQNIGNQSFTITNFPDISIVDSTSTACDANGFIQLNAGPSQGPLSYNWADLDGSNNGGIRVDLAAGDYKVFIKDENTGCLVEKDYTIEAAIGPDVTLEKDILACVQDSLMLFIVNNKEGIDTLSYNWNFPSSVMSNATDIATPTVFAENQLKNEMVEVTVTNQFGCPTTESFNISFRNLVPRPNIDFLLTANCQSTAVTFLNKNPDADLFIWNFGDPNTEGDTSSLAEATYTYPDTGTYIANLELRSDFRCSTQESVSVNKSVEVKTPINLMAKFDYKQDQCVKPDSLTFKNVSTLNIGAVDSLTWLVNGEIISTEDVFIQDVSDQTMEFNLTLEASSGLCRDTVTELIPFAEIRDTIPSIVTCMGETVRLLKFFSVPDAIYTWKENDDFENDDQDPMIAPDSMTTYSGTAVNKVGCTRITYLINPQMPPMYTKDENANVCNEEELATIGVALADDETDIVWSEDIDFQDIINDELSLTDNAGTYYVEIDNGCVVVDSLIIRNRQVNIMPSPPTTFCMPTLVQLSLNNQNEADTLTYNWLGIAEPANTSASPEVTANQTTEFEVEVTNQYGCQGKTSAIVFIGDTTLLASQELVADQNNIAPGGPAELSFSPPIPAGYSIDWPTDPTLMPNGNTATVRPEETRTYVVTITPEETAPSCPVEREIRINVGCNPDGVYFPNAFSPNGDGNNEILEVKGAEGLEAMNLIIFNRWGQKVFESNSPTNGWDGVFEGEPVCADVYGYYLTVTCPTSTIVKKGNVTVLK